MRSFTTLAGARVVCRAPAFLRNLRGGFYDLGRAAGTPVSPPIRSAMRARDTLTTDLPGR